jgi:hypothetical protein
LFAKVIKYQKVCDSNERLKVEKGFKMQSNRHTDTMNAFILRFKGLRQFKVDLNHCHTEVKTRISVVVTCQ